MASMDKRENIGCLKHLILLFHYMKCELIHLYHNQVLHPYNVCTLFLSKGNYPIPPNCTSDENQDKLIPCPYDSLVCCKRVWGINVHVMDYDIFKLHHPFSTLVAGPRGPGKSESVEQLLFLKRYIMRNPPEIIIWFTEDINQTCFALWLKKFQAFVRILKSCLIGVNETFVSSMISCRVRVGISWSKTSLLTEDMSLQTSVCSTLKFYPVFLES